jgi:ATP-dependent Clp endopeptidase proteolytic subunit ClpP
MSGKLNQITIKNEAKNVEIDIDGIIGVPEWWQFDNHEDKTSTYDKFTKAVNNIKNIKATDIVVNIRSLGGNINDALLIHDALAGLNASITTKCYGYTASAATIIAQAATDGKRYISDNSLYLIHKSSTYICGNINEIDAAKEQLAKTDRLIANIYAKKSGKDIADFETLMNEDNGNGKWLSPDEAKEYGLIDEIFNAPAIYNLSLKDLKNNKLPEIPNNKIINIKTQNEMKIKIKNGWKFIQNLFGKKADDEIEFTADDLQKLNDRCTELETQNTSQTNEISEQARVIEENKTTVAALNSKIQSLESDLAKAKAGKTETAQIEDPPVGNQKPLNENQKAYEEDVKNFKD